MIKIRNRLEKKGKRGKDNKSRFIKKKEKKLKKLKAKLEEKNESNTVNINEGKAINNDEDVEKFIDNIKKQKIEEENYLNACFLDDKYSLYGNYKYRCDNILSNLLIDEIFKEKSAILQILRFITKNNFLKEDEKN